MSLELLFIPMLLIVTALILMVIEVYVLPGFSIAGIFGLVLMVIAVGYAYNAGGAAAGVFVMVAAVGSTTGLGIFLWRSGAWDHFVHHYTLAQGDGVALPSGDHRRDCLGKIARAVTPLRPVGYIEVGPDRFEATTEGAFIASGSQVKIIAMDRQRFFVRLATQEEARQATP